MHLASLLEDDLTGSAAERMVLMDHTTSGGVQLRQEVKEALNLLMKRAVLSLPLLGLSVYLLIPLRPLSFFSSLPLVIVGTLLVGPLSTIFAEPTGSVFNPRGKTGRPHLAFSLPESRIMNGEYREALKLYREMLEVDPRRLEVYIRILELAFEDMKEPQVALETFREGMRNLSNQRGRDILSEEYRRLRAGYRG
ncbi:MAG: hypothetical protein AVO35_09685 [Candidatus Aegiribacteria sp. MLS_C]|nr:MAG: hypothetical protein AVO35_09685 [Candidatus Aegiribacteria sp. MLS_C]